MTEFPSFAVVGRTNEGKSSVVAALSENDSIRIEDSPNTTKKSTAQECQVNGQTLFYLYDTPGFEDAEAALQWLQAHCSHAADREQATREFLNAFRATDEFSEECELLEPILEKDADIIYVVDGSHPFSADFESEMEILQWTGRPRMALINPKAGDTYVADWQRALDQYFSIVRVFDAHHAPWQARQHVLRGFHELQREPQAQENIQYAINMLEQSNAERPSQAATLIATCLQTAATEKIRQSFDRIPPTESHLQQLLCQRLESVWRQHQKSIEELYHHHFIQTSDQRDIQELAVDAFTDGLFSKNNWELFGLSRRSLGTLGFMVGAGSGAPIGGVIDAHTGGASLFTGTLLGSIIGGGIGAWGAIFGGRQLGEMKILNQQVGQDIATFGPIDNPQFLWVLLDLCLLHQHTIETRSHARRDRLVLPKREGKQGLVEHLPSELRRKIERVFHQLRKHIDQPRSEDFQELQSLIRRAVTLHDGSPQTS